ncbi:MAG: hypothetical protein M1814_006461 [Vezdaea aestivalis]|nr:MAG: hypothetical protein M1814_006461 [Vezdaea aestivalis]
MPDTQAVILSSETDASIDMAEPFSLATGCFAVLGTADVVVRAGRRFHRFLCDIKDAPQAIERLKESVETNLTFVEESIKYLQDFKDNESFLYPEETDPSQVLNLFTPPIRALCRELTTLGDKAKKFQGPVKPWGRIKFVFDERNIQKSLARLECAKASLVVALLLVNSPKSAVRHKSLELTIQQNFEYLTSKIGAHPQALALLQESQEKVLKRIESSIQIGQEEYIETREHIAREGQKIIDTVKSEICDLNKQISTNPLSSSPKTARQIHLIGECQKSSLISLLLFENELHRAFVHILSRYSTTVTPQQLRWLQSEFESLKDSATQELAALSPGSTARSFDRWTYSHGAVGFSSTPVRGHPPSLKSVYGDEDEDPMIEDEKLDIAVQRKRLPSDYNSFLLRYADVDLRMMFLRSQNNSTGTVDLEEAGISFVPTNSAYATAVAVHFVKSMKDSIEPRLYAQINTFTVAKYPMKHLNLIANGTIQEVDDAFRKGEISPYHAYGDGRNICLYEAGINCRPDLLEYFEMQGLGMSNLNDQFSVLRGCYTAIWSLASRSGSGDLNALRRTLAYLDKNLASFTTAHKMISHFERLLNNSLDNDVLAVTKTWIEQSKEEGYDFNEEDIISMLLIRSLVITGSTSLALLRLFVDAGVGIHRTGLLGFNALQLVMISKIAGDESTSDLEAKLSLLIEKGVDVHHRTPSGHTPSSVARQSQESWTVWCRALERNGMNISTVLEEEEDGMWILDKSFGTDSAVPVDYGVDVDAVGKKDRMIIQSFGGMARIFTTNS